MVSFFTATNMDQDSLIFMIPDCEACRVKKKMVLTARKSEWLVEKNKIAWFSQDK